MPTLKRSKQMAEKKTRVLLDTYHLLTAFTGMRTYTAQLCEGIENYTLLKATYLIKPNWRSTDSSTYFKSNYNFFKKFLSHSGFFIWKQIILPLIIVTRRIDVVLCTDFVLPYFKFGARGIVVIHDTLYWEYKVNYNPRWRNYYTGMVYAGLDKSSIIVATSHYTAKKIKQFISDKHPVEVVYQSPQQLTNSKSRHEVLTNLKLSPQNYFLHVGTFDKRKNISTLVKAFVLLTKQYPQKQFKLVLAGAKGVEKTHDDYENIVTLIHKYELEDSVVLPGFVKNDELSTLYANAHAYIFPSLEEGFGIPLLEAMHFEIPLIISNKGSLQEIAGNAALVFDAENETVLANKMIEVTDPTIRSSLINKGKQRLASFSQLAFVQGIDSVIHKYAVAT
jgi:glycosyltransferase involved in cell wall biosynthesis